MPAPPGPLEQLAALRRRLEAAEDGMPRGAALAPALEPASSGCERDDCCGGHPSGGHEHDHQQHAPKTGGGCDRDDCCSKPPADRDDRCSKPPAPRAGASGPAPSAPGTPQPPPSPAAVVSELRGILFELGLDPDAIPALRQSSGSSSDPAVEVS